MKRTVFIFFPLLLLFEKSSGQISKDICFKEGDNLSMHYPLDSIHSISLHNFKGDHTLSKKQVMSLIPYLKKYTFEGNYAKTKPGQIWATITFLNGTTLPFYSNSSGEIIISKNGDKTFIPNGKLNFDNY